MSGEDRAGCYRLEEFLESLIAERGASMNTIDAYRRDLLRFQRFLGREPIEAATRQDILGYLGHLEEAGIAPASRARHLSAIKQFYLFAFEENWRADNPALDIVAPSKARKLPHVLSVEEAERLLGAARRIGRDEGERARNHALFEILYATGLRVSELVSLPFVQFAALPSSVVVRGKGSKDRLVPLSDASLSAIAAWLPKREEWLAKKRAASPFLFPSRAKSGHLTRVAFFNIVKQAAGAAGLGSDNISPHTLRHAVATHLLQGGANLHVIQSILGHADIATTEVYTHILDDNLRKLVHEHHPLARKRKGR